MFKKVAVTFVAIVLLAIIILPNIPHLKGMPRKELAEIVDSDVVVFNQTQIPKELLTKLSQYKVVMLGETHDIQEYPFFLFDAITQLNQGSNFNTLLLETSQAFSWIYEDYARGEIELKDPKMNELQYFTSCINNLRNYNLKLPEANRIKVHTIDFNTNRIDFVWSLQKMQEIINNNTLAELIKEYEDVLDYDKGTSILSKYKEILAQQNSGLSEEWHLRLTRMINAEIYSIQVRKHMHLDYLKDEALSFRESYIIETTDEYLKTATGNTLINIGASHIEKSPLYGDIKYLGEYLVEDSPYAKNSTYNILIGFSDFKSTPLSINTKLRFNNEIQKVVSTKIDNEAAFMPLDDKRFETENITFYHQISYKNLPLKQVYDALIVLPKGTLISSKYKHTFYNFNFIIFIIIAVIILLIYMIFKSRQKGLRRRR